jgi:hypothetical protein
MVLTCRRKSVSMLCMISLGWKMKSAVHRRHIDQVDVSLVESRFLWHLH